MPFDFSQTGVAAPDQHEVVKDGNGVGFITLKNNELIFRAQVGKTEFTHSDISAIANKLRSEKKIYSQLSVAGASDVALFLYEEDRDPVSQQEERC